MSNVLTAPSATEVEQILGTAWAVARLMGASFTEKCWNDLSREVASGLSQPARLADHVAYASDPATLGRLAHARVARLIARMIEESVKVPLPSGQVLLLDEASLIAALLDDLCLWPFWTKGC